jgi:hypothetical protein
MIINYVQKLFFAVGADPCVCPKIALMGAHAGAPLHSSSTMSKNIRFGRENRAPMDDDT